MVKLLLEKQAVRQAIMQETDDPARLPATLHLAEEQDLQAASSGGEEEQARARAAADVLGLLLRAVGDRLRRATHLHECYAAGMSYAEWEAEEAEMRRRKAEAEADAAAAAAAAAVSPPVSQQHVVMPMSPSPVVVTSLGAKEPPAPLFGAGGARAGPLAA